MATQSSTQSPTQSPYTCKTPPHLPKAALAAHPIPHPHLLTSPVTPHAAPRPAPFHPLTDDEREILRGLQSYANRHRPSDTTLVCRTTRIGNAPYLAKRPIIIGWLTDVCTAYRFQPTTLHLAVRHMDTFMALRFLEQDNWQLCAVTSLFVAAKCEEAGERVPVMDDLLYICEGIYDEHALQAMELCMITVFEWDIIVKTPVHFLVNYIAVIRRRVCNPAPPEPRPALARSARFAHQNAPPGPKATPLDGFLLDDDLDEDDDDYSMSTTNDCDCFDECSCGADSSGSGTELECEEDMAVEEHPAAAGCHCPDSNDPLEEIQRVATCVLDLSMYEIGICTKFSPQVVAAAALAVAVEVSSGSRVRQRDVAIVSNLWEGEIVECRTILWNLFQEAQG